MGTQFLTCLARCQLAWRLNSLVTWQIGSKSSPSLSCGRIRGPQIPKSPSYARLILFPAPPLDPAIPSSLGFANLRNRLNGRMLEKTLNPHGFCVSPCVLSPTYVPHTHTLTNVLELIQ